MLPIETLLNSVRENNNIVAQQNTKQQEIKATPAQSVSAGSDFAESAGEFVKAIFSQNETQGQAQAQAPAQNQNQQQFLFSPEQLQALQPPEQGQLGGNKFLLDILMRLFGNGA